MILPLNSFDLLVNPTILDRGRAYFRKGHVTAVTISTRGLLHATVEGSDTYTVEFLVQKSGISDIRCSCPYDMGPVCKHAVAVMFHLREQASVSSTLQLVDASGSSEH
jgi:uncharacterized Zn finger protein